MAGKTILILGGGWGGLAVAHDLRGQLSPEHRILVVEKEKTFSLYLSNLWIMTGERRYPDDVKREMSKLARQGIEWVHAEVQRIDPEGRVVQTSAGVLQGDYLVIALGAELAPQRVPGFAESAYNLYEARGALDLRRALTEFEGGRIVVLIARAPFRCPAAPYEAAFLLEWLVREQGIRERAEVAIYTPEKLPMPVAGPAVGEALRDMLTEHGIEFHPERMVSRIDGASHELLFDGEEVSYDLLVGIPPHKAPQVVEDAGLADSTGYVPVHLETMQILADPQIMATRFPGVFAIGDIAAVRLPSQLLLPKAGVFAEGEARVVAQNIAAEIRGQDSSARFDGKGFCYIEVGDGLAAYGSGTFYSYPVRVSLAPPSAGYRRDKLEYERLLETWFTL